MSQSNIYALKENGDLRLLAEIEGESDPALAVDALLDEMPRLKQREFVVIDLDNVMLVEATDEIVQPRRQMKIRSGNNVGPSTVTVEADEDEEDEVEVEETTVEPEPVAAPAPKRRGRPRGSKNAPKAPAARKNAPRKGKTPFKANPASAE